jgi:hypothetical protein
MFSVRANGPANPAVGPDAKRNRGTQGAPTQQEVSMRTIVLDTKLIDEFGDLSKVIDLCDASGRIVPIKPLPRPKGGTPRSRCS